MIRVPHLLAATLALLVVSVAVPAIAAPAPDTISCHMLIGGRPSTETQRFSWTPTGLYSDTHLISSTREIPLSSFTERDGTRVSAFAQHAWRGGKLHRTVWWQSAGQPKRVAMREVYDFRAQKIWDVTRKPLETCHHNGR